MREEETYYYHRDMPLYALFLLCISRVLSTRNCYALSVVVIFSLLTSAYVVQVCLYANTVLKKGNKKKKKLFFFFFPARNHQEPRVSVGDPSRDHR